MTETFTLFCCCTRASIPIDFDIEARHNDTPLKKFPSYLVPWDGQILDTDCCTNKGGAIISLLHRGIGKSMGNKKSRRMTQRHYYYSTIVLTCQQGSITLTKKALFCQ